MFQVFKVFVFVLCVDLMSHATQAFTFYVHVEAQGAKAKTVNRDN
jgi:hypothetical protein